MEAHQAAIVEIPEQSDRTGSSGYQVPNQAHARLQELRLRRHHNCRRRTAPPYSQRSICPASPTSQRPSCACDLECSPCCINHCLSSRLNVNTSIFAPEPFFVTSSSCRTPTDESIACCGTPFGAKTPGTNCFHTVLPSELVAVHQQCSVWRSTAKTLFGGLPAGARNPYHESQFCTPPRLRLGSRRTPLPQPPGRHSPLHLRPLRNLRARPGQQRSQSSSSAP